MSEPSEALQVALGAALISALSCDVYDAVPQGAAYPYVTLDSTTVNNKDFLSGRKDQRFVYLSVWSRDYGQAEVLRIMAEIDALHEQSLTLSTGEMASLRVERKRTVREPDGLTYQGQVTLRIITTH